MARQTSKRVGAVTVRDWTPGAVYCHDSGQNCGNCWNRRHFEGACSMPQAVAGLLESNTPMPSKAEQAKMIEACSVTSLSGLDPEFVKLAQVAG